MGLPASGKTTFSIKFKEFIELNHPNFKVKIVDPDKIRDRITPDKFDYKKEQIVRKKNLNEIESAIKEGYIVISDDLNYYSSMRHDLKTIAEKLNSNFFIIHISTPLEICLKWNKNRGELIPNSIIKKIFNKFDNFDKYRWDYPIAKINISEVKNYNEVFENLMNKIIKYDDLYSVFKKKEKIIERSSNTYNELLDKMTRKIVGKILKNQIFEINKEKLLYYRKEFIRTYLEKPLNNELITQTFLEYLEKNLNLKFT